MIQIKSIYPSNFITGITECMITYKAKSRDAGKAKVNIVMSGSDKIWFFENGGETKTLNEDEIILTNNYNIFEKTIQIKVRDTNRPGSAIIEITIADIINNKSSDSKGITYV